jgi:hypothetical protein
MEWWAWILVGLFALWWIASFLLVIGAVADSKGLLDGLEGDAGAFWFSLPVFIVVGVGGPAFLFAVLLSPPARNFKVDITTSGYPLFRGGWLKDGKFEDNTLKVHVTTSQENRERRY